MLEPIIQQDVGPSIFSLEFLHWNDFHFSLSCVQILYKLLAFIEFMLCSHLQWLTVFLHPTAPSFLHHILGQSRTLSTC